MDPVEKQYRASKYRIEMFDYDPGVYPNLFWVKFKVYRPRKWLRGVFYLRSDYVCGGTRSAAYDKAERNAKAIIKSDIEHWYNKKHKIKNSNSKTVYVGAE